MTGILIHTITVAILISVLTGIIGSFMVVRRMVFVGGGITHASFGGLGLGFFLGVNPIYTAALFALGSGLAVEGLSQKGRIREDSAIAAVWSLGMAVGILFSHFTPGYAPNLSAYLFGNILLVSKADLLMLAGFLVILIPLLLYYYKTLLFVMFDSEYASTRGRGVSAVRFFIIGFLSIGIVLTIRTMGVMMLMSMLTIPQMIASLYTHDFKWIIVLSIFISMLAALAGLAGSYFLNLPTGATIIVLLCICYVFAWLAKKAGQKPA
ncbi:MAG: metal ABC transporter permease [Porphyromonas sp.]|nr:metal ABC transporter permease [Porphyromonas sp.]